jgi:uncharacterized protein YkwD
LGEGSSPGQGTDGVSFSPTVGTVIPVTAAARARAASTAGLVALLATFLVVAGRADGAQSAGSAYLAPAGACRAADDAAAAVADQARAVACLVNWARRQEHRSRLLRRSALTRAAELKGQSVASCGQFSHTPCGTAVTSGVSAAGYRYATFGENLFAATGSVTPRQVVNAWLQSPPHRANMLSGRFRHVGAAPVRASGLLGGADAVVWTATFASPR